MSFKERIAVVAAVCALLLSAIACIKVDNTMGYSFVPDDERFVTKTVIIPLDSIYVGYIDSLSAYSSQRFTIGAIRDNEFGLTRRTAAFNIIPLADSLHWGKNIRNVHFHFGAIKDSLSYASSDQERILQNIRVYSLRDIGYILDTNSRYTNRFKVASFAGKNVVTDGIPTYDGSDSLSFDFSAEFTKKFLVDADGKSWEGRTQVLVDKLTEYAQTYPAVFLCVDDPDGSEYDGRLNYFRTAPVLTDYEYLSGTFIELSFTADYKGRQVDTSFFYTIGPTGTKYESSTLFYAFNCCEHESYSLKEDGRYGKYAHLDNKDLYLVSDYATIEGGAGIKPIIRAENLRNAVKTAIAPTLAKYGFNDVELAMVSKSVFLNKATVILPFDYKEETYEAMRFYPNMLSPTLAIHSSDGKNISYGGLTDAVVSDENQGTIDRSSDCYRPDIANHLQEILSLNLDKKNPSYSKNKKTLRDSNIWLFVLSNEVITSIASSTSNDNYLAYLNYYYGMMNGDYSSAYNNYYNYSMLQAMASADGSSTTSVQAYVMDKDRYYNAKLRGPFKDKAGTTHRDIQDSPRLVLTFSFLMPSALK